MVLIIISGPPATGKTAIAEALEISFQLPVLSKDRIKERLFDERGIGDLDWSRSLGKEAYETLERVLVDLIQQGTSFILEGNFAGATAQKIHQDAQTHQYKIISIRCDAPDDEIIKRMTDRWNSGRRHRGHLDDQVLAKIAQGRTWEGERKGVESDYILQLDENDSLEQNISKALVFVKKHL